MGNSDLIDITMELIIETAKAIGVSKDYDKESLVWLPKSQIEYVHIGGTTVEITLPEWLAKDKGLI